jgi:aminoglycoside phosphotransferase (APT) family kinase protein
VSSTSATLPPATDLAVAWILLPSECHEAFRAAYGVAGSPATDAATWARARGWALGLAVAMLSSSADNPLTDGIARKTLAAVLADE